MAALTKEVPGRCAGGKRFGGNCSRLGKFHERDKWWCKSHAPSEVRKRDDEWRSRWKRRSDAQTRSWAAKGREREAQRQFIDEALRVAAQEAIRCEQLGVPPSPIAALAAEMLKLQAEARHAAELAHAVYAETRRRKAT